MKSLFILSFLFGACHCFSVTTIRNVPATTRLPVAPLFADANNLGIESESISSSAATTQQQLNNKPSAVSTGTKRRINSVEQFARLPVWPVWNGVAIFLVSRVFGKDAAAKLEDAIGGRVCPNFFENTGKTSPFIMLVHHRHSFAAWDPLRYIQRTFFPEGFPAHPHRGFITVTYFLRGGFTHRDSMGIQQAYGAEERHQGKHTQYLMTGSGLLHEEMFDLKPDNAFGVSGQELYQLWLNVPAKNKLDLPFIQKIGGDEETPTVTTQEGVETIVLAGEYQDQSSAARLFSDISIFHVKMKSSSSWNYNLPSSHATGIMYIRTGSVTIDGETVTAHNTIYLTPFGEELAVTAGSQGADFLFLSGEPLMEPVAAQGSMVMNSGQEIQQAYLDYQAGNMGAPWDHKLTDEEWMEHVKRYPSVYK